MTSQQVTKMVRFRRIAGQVKECQASGMAKADWCREHGVNLSTYYNWQKEVRDEAIKAMQVEDAIAKPPKSKFAELPMLTESREDRQMRKQINGVIAYRNSGMGVMAWCKEQGISRTTLNRWQKEVEAYAQDITEEQGTSEGPASVSPYTLQPHFAQVPTVPELTESVASTRNPETAIRIQIGQAFIEIQKNTDVQLAEVVVRVMVEKC